MKQKVVVGIFAHRANLQWFETISLLQQQKILGQYPTMLICPVSMDTTEYLNLAPDLKVVKIPDKWFRDLYSYNRLKTSPFLYQKLLGYQFLLTYELDAYVFRDELDYWCDQGFDYIGAPWFDGLLEAVEESKPIGVGNSGFSLRNIHSCFSCAQKMNPYWNLHRIFTNPNIRILRTDRRRIADNVLRSMFGKAALRPVWALFKEEDFFWGLDCAELFPDFKVAPVEVAERFSWEGRSPWLYPESGGRLPFGCHAWPKVHPGFWKSHIQCPDSL